VPVVKVTTSSPHARWPIARQTPGGLAKWGDYHFVINQDIPACDAWVVIDDLQYRESCPCPPQRTILASTEPPIHGRYYEAFLAQFGLVVTCGGYDYRQPNVYESFPLQPWYFALNCATNRPNRIASQPSYFTYDQIKSLQPSKTRLLSVVCSAKVHSEGHKKRLEFVTALKRHFGDRLDWFGIGIRPIVDKSEAILDYKYHIAIENSCYPHYWTEKLADSYLGWALPIYYGCPNVTDYFDQRAMVRINLEDLDASISSIENALKTDAWEVSQGAIAQARQTVLDQYNFFPFVISLLSTLGSSGEGSRVVLRPHSHFVGRLRTSLQKAKAKLQFGWGITNLLPFLRKI